MAAALAGGTRRNLAAGGAGVDRWATSLAMWMVGRWWASAAATVLRWMLVAMVISGGWKGSGGISWPAWRPLRWQCLWVLLPSLEASERTSFLPPLPGAQVKTSDPPVPSDDDTTVACSFLKALLGGCSSGGGSGGGSVSTHAFWSASSWRLRRRRRRSSGGATADGRGIVGSLRH